jgi:outer membrane lipoprotein-sorting protein
MEKAITFALAALVLLALASGCAQQPAPGPSEGPVSTEMDDELSGLDELDTDLDISELDSLDAEFAELEAMFS